MAKLTVKAGSTSRLEHVFILDSTSTTGAGKTGLTNASVTMYYFRPADTVATSVTLSAGTLGTWSSGGFKEVDATNMPGLYEIGMPNAVFAATFNHSVVMVKGAGIAPVVLEYNLVSYDPLDTVRLGLTALPNTAVTTNGSLITSGSGTDQLTVSGGRASANTTQWNSVTVTGMPMPTYTQPTGFLTATFPTTVASTTNITAASGVQLAAVTHTGATIPTVTTVTNRVSANTDQWGGVAVTGMPMPTYTQPTGFLAATFPTTVASTTNITGGTITTVSGNVNGSVASVTGAVGSVTGAVGSVTGAVGSVTGAVGSVTGNVGGNVTGSVGSLSATAKTDAASGVWTALVSTYDATSTNTTATMAKAILKSDATTKNGDVTMYSISGTNGIDVDIHRIDNDRTAATNLKNMLNGTGGVTISATLDALSTTERNAVSDALLNRNIAGGSSTGRLVKDAFRALRNKSAIVGTTLTVYQEDDTTSAWTATVSSSATADPVTGIDPA